MSAASRVLLVNPTITSARSARFPLAILSLAARVGERHPTTLIDGNLDRDFIATTVRALDSGNVGAVGISVMGGPQLPSAIALSKAIRAASPATPIIWGGHFPTNRPDASLASPFVDYAVRGQGEETLEELIDALFVKDDARVAGIAGLSHRGSGGTVHNAERAFSAGPLTQQLPYRRLAKLNRYLTHTCLGVRTAGYQAALGCRFRCTFCGVAGMFRGRTALPTAARLEEDLQFLRALGTDAIQFYDHNFFDREVDMVPLLEVLARFSLPWWCFARADALLNL